jgi:8-oxo-dGTP pyrophosphatase MutT (NUDIX family)
MIPLLQSGVLAYRHTKTGKIEILVVKKPRSQNWGIPKGKLEPGLSPAENAAKEAFEEAGVKGRIGREALGAYRAIKRIAGDKTLIEVTVFLLEVTRSARQWPEKTLRQSKWCSPADAARLLREPLLVRLCHEIDSGMLLSASARAA